MYMHIKRFIDMYTYQTHNYVFALCVQGVEHDDDADDDEDDYDDDDDDEALFLCCVAVVLCFVDGGIFLRSVRRNLHALA